MTEASGLRADAQVLLADLIGFATVTSESNLDLIGYAEAHLAGFGIRTSRSYDHAGAKANLLASIGPPVSGGVVLSGHTDVVPADRRHWMGDPFVASLRDERIYGRGAADMKGFIACVLAMAPRFRAAELGAPVHIALTFDEEVGCVGAPILLAELAETGLRPSGAIVGEPTSMRVVEAHKGCYEYTTHITGVAGHGSAPHKAVNAVEYAARYISRLMDLKRELVARQPAEGVFDPPHSTISVGTIQGGDARNVAAGECHFEWEFRPVGDRDRKHLSAAVAHIERDLDGEMRLRHPDAGIVTRTVGAVDGLEAASNSPAVELVCALMDDPVVEVASFVTEAGLYQQSGIPAVVCGPGSIDAAHRPNEFVSLEQLDRCLDMLERLGAHLTSPGR